MRANIRGEESDTFTNAAGETARVSVGADAAETAESLLRVLGGDAVAAELLAQQVHGRSDEDDDGVDLQGCAGEIPDLPMDGFNFANMGIWVDPIGECIRIVLLGSIIIYRGCSNPVRISQGFVQC